MKQEMMGWQWNKLDHTQIICTSLQTDNHASTSQLSFYRPDGCPSCRRTNSVKALKAIKALKTNFSLTLKSLVGQEYGLLCQYMTQYIYMCSKADC